MIDLYTWSTSNGRKVSIALEEMALPYTVHPIDIYKGDQFSEAFTKVSINNKIPAIVDQESQITLFESGAILLYLAEKTQSFYSILRKEKWQILQWLMWQMSGFGPTLGQAAHFLQYNPGNSAYSDERFHNEAKRLYSVLDGALSTANYIAGEYSIADIAIWPWTTRFEHQKINLRKYPHVLRWYKNIAERPAVVRGYQTPDASVDIPIP